LKYIDLSDTVWDRKGVEYLVQALNWTTVTPSSASISAAPDSKDENGEKEKEVVDPEVGERKESYGSFGRYAPYLKEAEGSDAPSAVQTLRMDGCNLRAFVLEALGQFGFRPQKDMLTSSDRCSDVRYQEPITSA
jgi:protein phosphatase 1 regulatory subunit 37